MTNINVKSTNTENTVPMTICKYCLFSNPFPKRIAWTAISKILNIKLVVPTLKFVIRLNTYGTQIKGEVPKFALIDNDAPKEIMNNDIKYNDLSINLFHINIHKIYFKFRNI